MLAAIDSSSTCCGIITSFHCACAIRPTKSGQNWNSKDHQEQNGGNQYLLHGIISSLKWFLHLPTAFYGVGCFLCRPQATSPSLLNARNQLVHFLRNSWHVKLVFASYKIHYPLKMTENYINCICIFLICSLQEKKACTRRYKLMIGGSCRPVAQPAVRVWKVFVCLLYGIHDSCCLCPRYV